MITPNFGFELLNPSQEQPEVPLDFNWNKLDALLLELGGSITVEQLGDSPGISDVRTLIFEGSTVIGESNGRVRVVSDTSSGASSTGSADVVLQLACSDLVTALATGASVAYVRAPQAFTLTAVRSSVLVDSSSGLVTVAIKNAGSDILSTDLSIDATEFTSVTAATPAVISAPAIGDDALLTIDITAAGTGAKGLIVTLIGHV
jgi:hypothetical protein